MMLDHKKIDEARKVLGLGEEATMIEIRDVYRKLALKYHPDKCVSGDEGEREEMFKKINEANETLMMYCANYRFSFRKEDMVSSDMDKENYDHMKRFYDGWWGDLEI